MSKVLIGEIRGPQGPEGPQGEPGEQGAKGLDGANVLPTSAAVAQAVREPGEARTELLATIAGQAGPIATDAARVVRPRRMSMAGLGDSLANIGGVSIMRASLVAAAVSGATSISVTPLFGSGSAVATQMASNFAAGTLIRVGSEFAVVAASAFTGTGPFTVNLAAALTAPHASGEAVVTMPMVQAQDAPQPAFIAHMLSDGALRYAGTYGHGGYKASEIAAIHLPLVLAAQPGFCNVMAGRNGETTLAATITAVTGIWDALLNAGIVPIANTLPPLATPTADDSKFNAKIRAEAARRGIPLADNEVAMVNMSTGAWRAEYNSDGTHPNNAGRKLQGVLVWDAVKNLVQTVRPFPTANAQLNTTVHPFPPARVNAKMLTTGGDIIGAGTSAVPDLWRGSAVDADGVFSIVDAPRGGGKAIKYTRTAGGTATNTLQTEAGQTATLIPGRRYRFVARIKTEGLEAARAASSASTISIAVTNTGASGTTTFGRVSPFAIDIDGALVWDFLCTSAQPTVCGLWVNFSGNASTPTYAVTLWDIDLIDLTELGETSEWPLVLAQ